MQTCMSLQSLIEAAQGFDPSRRVIITRTDNYEQYRLTGVILSQIDRNFETVPVIELLVRPIDAEQPLACIKPPLVLETTPELSPSFLAERIYETVPEVWEG